MLLCFVFYFLLPAVAGPFRGTKAKKVLPVCNADLTRSISTPNIL